MTQLKAIGIGILIWILGVLVYTVSFYLPLLEDLELQANILLSLGIIPIVWLGARLYYRKNSTTKGYWLGLSFFFIAAVLDSLITVPYLIIPNGGSYFQFYTAFGFWLIGLEFVLTTTVYWYSKIASDRMSANSLQTNDQ